MATTSTSPYGMNYGTQVGRAVVRQFGGRWTPEKQRFFDAWARAEGTKAAYNPFGTTRKGFPGESQFNSVGVKNYPDLQTGIKATYDTLSLDYYTQIVSLLRQDNVTAEDLAKAVASSPWGTGTGVLRVLGVTTHDGYERASSTAQYGAKKGQLEEQYQKITLDRLRPSEAYLQTLERLGTAGAPALRVAKGFQPFTLEVPVGGEEVTPTAPSGGAPAGRGFQPKGGGVYVLPYSWQGTHITDNLDLNKGAETAIDIMLDPGTPVGAPEAGEVVRWGSAQGGEALYFRGASGRTYWLGHIDNRVPVGTKVKRGQILAYISADHAAPHAHWDATPPPSRRRK